MRILVTGHNGYIGSVLVPMLEQADHEIVGLVSDLFALCIFGQNGHEVESLRPMSVTWGVRTSPASTR